MTIKIMCQLLFILFKKIRLSSYLIISILIILQVADVKKNIETVQGSDVYPAAQQMLIHQGKVLKDETTLEENKVAEGSFIVIMLSKVILFSCHLEKISCAITYTSFHIF